MNGRVFVLAWLLWVQASAATAQGAQDGRLDLGQFHSFVANWHDDRRPLCAFIRSEAAWARIFHPAPVMAAAASYAPAESFWRQHAVLLVARVTPGGGADPFYGATVRRAGGRLLLDYRFRPPASSGFSVKSALAFTVGKPWPASVQVRDGGKPECVLKPEENLWAAPMPPAG